MKTLIASVALFALAGPAAALEPPPLSDLQVACYGMEDGLAVHVVDARLYPCGPTDPHCFPRYVGVTVVVDEVISPSTGSIHVGDTIQASFSAAQPVSRPQDSRDDGSLSFAPGAPLSQETVASTLEGGRLLLAVATVPRALWGGIPSEVDEPYHAEVYPAEEEPWFRGTWGSAACRQEQAKAEVVRRKRGLR